MRSRGEPVPDDLSRVERATKRLHKFAKVVMKGKSTTNLVRKFLTAMDEEKLIRMP